MRQLPPHLGKAALEALQSSIAAQAAELAELPAKIVGQNKVVWALITILFTTVLGFLAAMFVPREHTAAAPAQTVAKTPQEPVAPQPGETVNQEHPENASALR